MTLPEFQRLEDGLRYAHEILKGSSMKELTCSECGIVFSVSESYVDYRRRDHRTFYCPNGHGQVFNAETEADKFKRMYENATARNSEIAHKLEVSKRSETKVKKELKSLKLRSAAGVCPCCNRTFSQLAQHMATKHHEFLELQGVTPPKALIGEVMPKEGGS